MPTIIALDTSLSMTRPVPAPHKNTGAQTPSSEEIHQSTVNFHHLAIVGINQILDYLAHHSRLEFVSLVSFSVDL